MIIHFGPIVRSQVAGILDRQQGLRVLIDDDMNERSLRKRKLLTKREQLFVHPKLTVVEPVPAWQWPLVVDEVRDYVLQQLAPVNHCGGCRQCCFTPYIPEKSKPSHSWCRECTATGCGSYWQRPQVCRKFECMWLKSQKRNDRMSEDLRPDRCGVIFVEQGEVFEVHPSGPIGGVAKGFIDEMQAAGWKAKLITHYFGEGG